MSVSLRTYFLTTDRLGFSHWNEGDLASAMTLWGDPRVAAFIGGPFTEEDVRARLCREIEMLLSCKVQYWPLFLLKDGELAGCAGLRPYGDDQQILELGFHFRPEYWGQGLAQEAARAVIAFAFETLELKSLFAGHHPENARVRAAAPETRVPFYPPGNLSPDGAAQSRVSPHEP